ncbi:hypothetical protein CPB84DRAFT_1752831 [Gymnopilus junonius]|uniref:Uncharacterized protein n=1 Tax=Gymnopilus junonius TaxID=109634 RepID=A0A9P5TFM1_GYMJU|nr:hypothetical protein CPB84DRAFT_1752831 [Gymnopilus junonius]
MSFLNLDTKKVTQYVADRVKLRSLHIDRCPLVRTGTVASWFKAPQSPLDISELRSLQLTNPYYPVVVVDEILALSSKALENLTLSVDLYGPHPQRLPEKTPDLGSLHNLCHLTIHTRIRSLPYWQPDVKEKNDLSYIATMLKTLPFNTFRPRQLQLDILMPVNLSDFDTNLPLLPWSDLIGLLEDAQMAPCFSSVHLRIKRLRYEKDLQPKDVDMTPVALAFVLDKNDGLKRLREKGLLFSYNSY